jgi:uncharacterized protein YgiM (DUF1202 family)
MRRSSIMSDQKPTVIINNQKKLGCFGSIGVLVVIFIVVGMCNSLSKKESGSPSTGSSSSVSRTSSVPQFTLDIKPDSQKQFEEIVATYAAEYDKGENELQQSVARNSRKKAFQQLGVRSATDWVGTLSDLSTNNDGKAVIAVKLGDIEIKTWNNAFSDIGYDTLIDLESALFKSLLNAKKGANVRFSGSFFSGDDLDYVKENSLTIRGSMRNPEFIFKFADVVVIGNKPITSSDVNLREQPSVESEKLVTIPKGSEVKLLGNAADDGWIKISFEDQEGYVNKQYLTY